MESTTRDDEVEAVAATTSIVLDVLTQTAAAHGVYEEQVLGGVYDQQWPQWYARHMARLLVSTGYRIVGPENRPGLLETRRPA